MDKTSYKVFRSLSTSPKINLSLEEHFLSTVEENECILLFWQSENAVVIGRNQNPYQECNLAELDNNKVVLVRRLSGGGAVYHDLGNLNFAFISKNTEFNAAANFAIILKALRSLNVFGVFNGRNDLIAEGRKFSGNAFVHDDRCHLHHGTLLIDTDVNRIERYLSVSHHKFENKGFDSIKSRVINLKEINDKISVELIVQQVISVINEQSKEVVELNCIDENFQVQEDYIEKYNSHQWNYGETPSFNGEFEEKFPWGIFSLHLNIDNGCINDLKIYTDAMMSEAFYQLNKALNHQALNREFVFEAILKTQMPKNIQNDLKYFFDKHIFS